MYQFEKKIEKLCSTICQFDFKDYLHRNGRQLYGLIINVRTKKFDPLFGDPSIVFLNFVNEQYIESTAGYRVDFDKRFQTNFCVDVFLISSKLYKKSAKLIEPIVLHELAHLLIDSNNVILDIDNDSKILGQKIYNLTYKDYGMDSLHSLIYCQLLAQICKEYSRKVKKNTSAEAIIKSAMRDDIIED